MAGTLVSGIMDPGGRFKIELSRPGRYRVVPSLKGFVYARPARIKTGREAGVWAQVAEGRTVPRIELRMVKAGAIVGKVLTATGETLPGNVASVTLLQHIRAQSLKVLLKTPRARSFPMLSLYSSRTIRTA